MPILANLRYIYLCSVVITIRALIFLLRGAVDTKRGTANISFLACIESSLWVMLFFDNLVVISLSQLLLTLPA
jgi:hypothetical protein